jgi:hypothetical protein
LVIRRATAVLLVVLLLVCSRDMNTVLDEAGFQKMKCQTSRPS